MYAPTPPAHPRKPGGGSFRDTPAFLMGQRDWQGMKLLTGGTKRSKVLKRAVSEIGSLAILCEAEQGLRNLVECNASRRRAQVELRFFHSLELIFEHESFTGNETRLRAALDAAEDHERTNLLSDVAQTCVASGHIAPADLRLYYALVEQHASGSHLVQTEEQFQRSGSLHPAFLSVSTEVFPAVEFGSRACVEGEEGVVRGQWEGRRAVQAGFLAGGARVGEERAEDWCRLRCAARDRREVEEEEGEARDEVCSDRARGLLQTKGDERNRRRNLHVFDVPGRETAQRCALLDWEYRERRLLELRLEQVARAALWFHHTHPLEQEEVGQRLHEEYLEAHGFTDLKIAHNRGEVDVLQHQLTVLEPPRKTLAAAEVNARLLAEGAEQREAGALWAAQGRLVDLRERFADGVGALVSRETVQRGGVRIAEGSSREVLLEERGLEGALLAIDGQLRREEASEVEHRLRLEARRMRGFCRAVYTGLLLPLCEESERGGRLEVVKEWREDRVRLAGKMLPWLTEAAVSGRSLAELLAYEEESREQIAHAAWVLLSNVRDAAASFFERKHAEALEMLALRRQRLVVARESSDRLLLAEAADACFGDALARFSWQGEYVSRRSIIRLETTEYADLLIWALQCAESWQRYVIKAESILGTVYFPLYCFDSMCTDARGNIELCEEQTRCFAENRFQQQGYAIENECLLQKALTGDDTQEPPVAGQRQDNMPATEAELPLEEHPAAVPQESMPPVIEANLPSQQAKEPLAEGQHDSLPIAADTEATFNEAQPLSLVIQYARHSSREDTNPSEYQPLQLLLSLLDQHNRETTAKSEPQPFLPESVSTWLPQSLADVKSVLVASDNTPTLELLFEHVSVPCAPSTTSRPSRHLSEAFDVETYRTLSLSHSGARDRWSSRASSSLTPRNYVELMQLLDLADASEVEALQEVVDAAVRFRKDSVASCSSTDRAGIACARVLQRVCRGGALRLALAQRRDQQRNDTTLQPFDARSITRREATARQAITIFMEQVMVNTISNFWNTHPQV
ncbi:hypothetical protein DIPPA_26598 [Diplonema papillatum]|nr:hypothetical protein DIPPA_26598 [Diplonema papillatum]